MARKPKFDTLTTAGRIAKAAYERDKKHKNKSKKPTCSKASRAQARTPSPPASKKRKTAAVGKNMATKNIGTSTSKDESLLSGTTNSKQKTSTRKLPEKPMERPNEQDGVGSQAPKSKSRNSTSNWQSDKSEFGGTAKRSQSLMSFMRDSGQMSGLSLSKPKKQSASQEKRESVLVRPTGRTRRSAQSQSKGDETVEAVAKENQRVGLMDLPVELRQHIWSLAVVATKFFVYPATAPEQPDLAMTSRQIRSEVLPLFYGENIFGIEVPARQPKGKKFAASISMRPVQQWLAMVQKAGYLPLISKWAFVWTPLSQNGNAAMGADSVLADQDVILHLRFPKPDSPSGSGYDTELHRQAFCMLPAYEAYGKCSLEPHPDWLTDAVAESIVHGQDRLKQIMAIAKELEAGGRMLFGSTCQNVEHCEPTGDEGTTG